MRLDYDDENARREQESNSGLLVSKFSSPQVNITQISIKFLIILSVISHQCTKIK